MKLEQIIKRLPHEPTKPALVSGLLVELEQGIDSLRSHPVIIVLTDRRLTLKGGDGRNGVDGIDMNNIRQALRAVLGEDRGSGFVTRFVVRERRLYPAGAHDVI